MDGVFEAVGIIINGDLRFNGACFVFFGSDGEREGRFPCFIKECVLAFEVVMVGSTGSETG